MANLATAIADFTPAVLQQVSQGTQDDSTNYVFFNKGDILSVEATYETGWWYGFVKFKNPAGELSRNENQLSQSDEEGEEIEENKKEREGEVSEQNRNEEKNSADAKEIAHNTQDKENQAVGETKSNEDNSNENENEKKSAQEVENKVDIHKPPDDTPVLGFFPSNYVNLLVTSNKSSKQTDNKEEASDNDGNDSNEETSGRQVNYRETVVNTGYTYNYDQGEAKRKNDVDWMSYAKGFIDDNMIETQTRVRSYATLSEEYDNADFKAPSSNMIGVLGYKKIKINSAEDFKANIPGAILSQGAAAIPIKDQSPLSKAYRQLYHYFDYESWNEQMNKGGFHKARPDASRKKDKKKKLKI